MFCRQCEQTVGGKGCTQRGVCGKSPEAADLMDALIHLMKGIAWWGRQARELEVKDTEVDHFLMEGLFLTVTNVNFDVADLEAWVRRAVKMRGKANELFRSAYRSRQGRDFAGPVPAAVEWTPAAALGDLVVQSREVGILADPGLDEDIRSLREILLYGLKGMAAYAHHAARLGKESEEVNAFLHAGLAALLDADRSAGDLIKLIMDFGLVNLKCMEMLDGAHTSRFGHPEPTEVWLGTRQGPAILVSGHDLRDLEELLEATKDTGISIYTHGEMLPAHGYPKLKKYPHLAGHYGGAWQEQQKEFDLFPGAILMTTNCIQKPRPTYQDRIFTTGLVGWPGLNHIPETGGPKDFGPVIKKALEAGGFPAEAAGKKILVGFGHQAILSVAGTVVEAVKTGQIRRFLLIGGCDGAKPGRNYYTELAQLAPQDCLILTLACGKFRFNKLEFGTVAGLPRLLDCGQCNDAYSAIKVAAALAEAFKCGLNDLPLSLVLSWYEQKAVCILLTLLALGIRDIRLGPSLPAFVSPNVLKVLVEKFNIQPITTPEADLKAILGN